MKSKVDHEHVHSLLRLRRNGDQKLLSFSEKFRPDTKDRNDDAGGKRGAATVFGHRKRAVVITSLTIARYCCGACIKYIVGFSRMPALSRHDA